MSQKSTKEKKIKPSFDLQKDKYTYAVGRRKRATAQVRLYQVKKVGENDYLVNNRPLDDYFFLESLRATFLSPLTAVGQEEEIAVSALVRGGGISAQAEAIRLGIARALVKIDEAYRPILKANGFLTRDARKVERKKPGLKKARRAPQWSKR